MSDIKSFHDWQGELPKKCDRCSKPIRDIFIDGGTVFGAWAIMCPLCFMDIGVGLGIGKGQKYLKGSKADILHIGRDYDSSVKEVNESEDE